VHARHDADVQRLLTPRTDKIIKNGLNDIFERGENLLQNGVLHFVFRFSQSSEMALER